jgi:hypothetical protein
MVLLVRNKIFMFAFLNKFVKKVVSLPMYVKVAHLCVGGCMYVAAVCSLDVSGGVPVVGGVVVVDWEGIVLQDVLYGGDLFIIIIFL